MDAIFTYRDYRKYLREHVEKAEWGAVSRMAEATGCQRSQISRVASGHLHLTTDQAFALADFWNFNEAEADYFMKLVEHARTGNRKYRERLARDLESARTAQENLSKRLRQPAIGSQEVEAVYYSSWHWAAIHILVSIPEFQTPKRISEHLSLPADYVESCLSRLESFGMVRREGSRWVFGSHTIHLPKASPFVSIHHSNWRQRAVIDSQLAASEGMHYTVVQSISRKDFEKVKHMLLKTIEDYNRIAAPSVEEELVCFSSDFFKV